MAAFTDVNTLPVVNAATARQVLNAAIRAGTPQPAFQVMPLRFVDPEKLMKPGVERWSIKTGQDAEAGQVGNLGVAPGKGIVPVTVEELIRIPRPADMLPVTKDIKAYDSRRAAPVEFTVWQVTASIIFLRLEDDGDYHLELQ